MSSQMPAFRGNGGNVSQHLVTGEVVSGTSSSTNIVHLPERVGVKEKVERFYSNHPVTNALETFRSEVAGLSNGSLAELYLVKLRGLVDEFIAFQSHLGYSSVKYGIFEAIMKDAFERYSDDVLVMESITKLQQELHFHIEMTSLESQVTYYSKMNPADIKAVVSPRLFAEGIKKIETIFSQTPCFDLQRIEKLEEAMCKLISTEEYYAQRMSVEATQKPENFDVSTLERDIKNVEHVPTQRIIFWLQKGLDIIDEKSEKDTVSVLYYRLKNLLELAKEKYTHNALVMTTLTFLEADLESDFTEKSQYRDVLLHPTEAKLSLSTLVERRATYLRDFYSQIRFQLQELFQKAEKSKDAISSDAGKQIAEFSSLFPEYNDELFEVIDDTIVTHSQEKNTPVSMRAYWLSMTMLEIAKHIFGADNEKVLEIKSKFEAAKTGERFDFFADTLEGEEKEEYKKFGGIDANEVYADLQKSVMMVQMAILALKSEKIDFTSKLYFDIKEATHILQRVAIKDNNDELKSILTELTNEIEVISAQNSKKKLYHVAGKRKIDNAPYLAFQNEVKILKKERLFDLIVDMMNIVLEDTEVKRGSHFVNELHFAIHTFLQRFSPNEFHKIGRSPVDKDDAILSDQCQEFLVQLRKRFASENIRVKSDLIYLGDDFGYSEDTLPLVPFHIRMLATPQRKETESEASANIETTEFEKLFSSLDSLQQALFTTPKVGLEEAVNNNYLIKLIEKVMIFEGDIGEKAQVYEKALKVLSIFEITGNNPDAYPESFLAKIIKKVQVIPTIKMLSSRQQQIREAMGKGAK